MHGLLSASLVECLARQTPRRSLLSFALLILSIAVGQSLTKEATEPHSKCAPLHSVALNLTSIPAQANQGDDNEDTTRQAIRGEAAINGMLRRQMREAGVNAAVEDSWVVVPNRPRLCGRVVREVEVRANITTLQLDLYVELEHDRIMVESFSGIGADREAAVEDALESLSRSTLPVLLAGLYDAQVERVKSLSWPIRGQDRTVTISSLSARGRLPDPKNPPRAWIEILKDGIARAELDEKPHWVRFYFSHQPNGTESVEVLMDNQRWDALERSLASQDWPSSREFYSLRVFLLIE